MRILALIGLSAPAAALVTQSVTGRWVTDDGKAIVSIADCGGSMCGRIARILAPTPNGPPVDANNPDEQLRTRPIIGLQVLSGFTPAGDVWNGRIYGPEEGRSYRSVLRRSGPGTIEVKGCIAFFCKTQIWTRAK